MTRDQVIAMACEAGIQANVGYIIGGEYKPAVSALKTSVPVEWLEALVEKAVAAERERICAAIKAEDDHCVAEGDYMLDSDECIEVARGDWVRPDYSVEVYMPPPPTQEQLRIRDNQRLILAGAMRARQ